MGRASASLKSRPDAVLMVSHPDAAHWTSELASAGWTGTTVLLVPADDCDDAEALMQHPGVICLAAENVEAPYFPRLLDRLVQTDRTQHLRRRLRQAEDALSQLQRFDTLKGQFIQNVSHELRTPLAIVKGYVDLIAEGSLWGIREPILNQAIRPSTRIPTIWYGWSTRSPHLGTLTWGG